VVARVRRQLKTRAVGHAGTLDPFATGLLVVLVGRATRLARFVEQQPKRYTAIARLGVATSTDDLTGEAIGGGFHAGGPPTASEVRQELRAMLGRQLQRPPAYSAKLVGGVRSYRRARRGETVELPAVEVELHEAELLDYSAPMVTFRVTVSPGTYVRAIARDLGDRLGCGAHLVSLRRDAIGGITLAEAVPLEGVTPASLRPPLDAVAHLPRIEVDASQARAIGFGQRPEVGTDHLEGRGPVTAIDHSGNLVAVGQVVEGRFEPQVVLEAAG
jgi:tRNA pseudouridine55 synthase